METSMLFYAEGTRSRDGALHAFKKGAFVTAIAYGLPILPIGHAGCYRIWSPLRFGLRSGPVVVEVGQPIPVEHLAYDDREPLRDQTFEAVRELRARARKRIRELGVEPGGID
jgi:1-acyl-sn-glycerol-3-phosphate acyltransferase